MAIAYNAGTTGGTGNATSTIVASPNVAGTNTMGVVHVTTGSGDNLTALNWDGVDMFTSNLVAKIKVGNFNNFSYMYLLKNPAAGVTNVSAAVSVSNNIDLVIESYTGCKQVNTADALKAVSALGGTSESASVTTVADNCWLVSNIMTTGTAVTAGANTTKRNSEIVNNQLTSGDSNTAETPPGSFSQAFSWTTASDHALIVASLAPAPLTRMLPLMGVGT